MVKTEISSNPWGMILRGRQLQKLAGFSCLPFFSSIKKSHKSSAFIIKQEPSWLKFQRVI